MSRQFDVFVHPVAAMRRTYPYLIVLQHESFQSTDTVVVAPLVAPLNMPRSRGYPVLTLRLDAVMLLTPNLATIVRRRLEKPVANLEDQRARIVAALDVLFVGS